MIPYTGTAEAIGVVDDVPENGRVGGPATGSSASAAPGHPEGGDLHGHHRVPGLAIGLDVRTAAAAREAGDRSVRPLQGRSEPMRARCEPSRQSREANLPQAVLLLGPDIGKQLLGNLARPVLAGIVAVALALPAPVASAGDVYDGDTIEVEGQPARLYGIDAFELSQTCLDAHGRPWRCGVAAKAALAERVEGQALQCVVLDEDRDGWYVSRCVSEDGTDLGAYMVRSGLALADTEDYLTEQADARRRGAGAWEGAFLPPWQWRADGR